MLQVEILNVSWNVKSMHTGNCKIKCAIYAVVFVLTEEYSIKNCSKTIKYLVIFLALFNMFYANLCNTSMLGEGHQTEWMRYQNTLKA